MSSRQEAIDAMHEWANRASDAEKTRSARSSGNTEAARALKNRDEAIRMVEMWREVVGAHGCSCASGLDD